MSRLFAPLPLRGVTLRNRILVSPMCQYSCKEGYASDWHLVHLGSRAVGGAGCVIAEATAVEPEGRISAADCGLWEAGQAEAWKPVTRFLKEHGAVAAIQLAHAGRKASTAVPWEGKVRDGWTPKGPSPIAFSEGDAAPRELTEAETAALPARFAASAKLALEAGFEAVELHFAHGYLVHQFLSPLSNRRADRYGGSFDNRARLALEIAAAVRRVWPDRLPVLVRVSATDWADGGWDLPECVELARKLKAAGADFIDCSSGGLVPHARIPAGPGFQVPFAKAIREATGLPTGAVGFITKPEQAEAILEKGEADAVLLARELLRDPYWPLRAGRALGAQAPWPKQYLRARD